MKESERERERAYKLADCLDHHCRFFVLFVVVKLNKENKKKNKEFYAE